MATQTAEYVNRAYMISEKMRILSGYDVKININDILSIFADKKGNANLFSKMLKILELVSIKEDIPDQVNQGITKK